MPESSKLVQLGASKAKITKYDSLIELKNFC